MGVASPPPRFARNAAKSIEIVFPARSVSRSPDAVCQEDGADVRSRKRRNAYGDVVRESAV